MPRRGVFGATAGFKKALNLTQEDSASGVSEFACFGRIFYRPVEGSCRPRDYCAGMVAVIQQLLPEYCVRPEIYLIHDDAATSCAPVFTSDLGLPAKSVLEGMSFCMRPARKAPTCWAC